MLVQVCHIVRSRTRDEGYKLVVLVARASRAFLCLLFECLFLVVATGFCITIWKYKTG